MDCGVGLCGHCQLGPTLICRDGPVYSYAELAPWLEVRRAVSAQAKPKLAVWKFASCDGCQLSLLDLEDELLALAGAVELAEFREATSGVVEGPYDLSLVEGSITTAHDAERIQEVRARVEGARHDRRLRDRGRHPGAAQLRRRRRVRRRRLRLARVHLDARDLDADRGARRRSTSSCTAARSTSASCSRSITAFLHGRKPGIPSTSVCTECKRRGIVCVTVAHGTPCLGPVTHAGCGALCPAYNRGCYGCFGPMETPNTAALVPLLRRSG